MFIPLFGYDIHAVSAQNQEERDGICASRKKVDERIITNEDKRRTLCNILLQEEKMIEKHEQDRQTLGGLGFLSGDVWADRGIHDFCLSAILLHIKANT